MSHKVRPLVTLALLALLVASPAAALPVEARAASAQSPSVLAGVWDWFSFLVSGLWEKEGSSMDPDGLNAAGCPGEESGIMDPNGQPLTCHSIADWQMDAGSQMDPNG